MTSSDTPQNTDELRAEIARTRSDLGDTAAALAAKTDVKARAKESAARTADRAKASAARTADRAKTSASHTADRAKTSASHTADRATEKAGELRERAADEVATTRRQLDDGDVAGIARRPAPIIVIGAVAAAVAALAAVLIRRARS
jgi:cobalamin biosynthesis Mg chelatase CobN